MKRLKALQWYWYGLVIVIFLCLMEIWGILGNWSMIVLVAVTMMYVVFIHKSIENTNISRQEDRMLHQEDREIDFKRRKLDWIVNWAREVRKVLRIDMLRWGRVILEVGKYDMMAQLESYAVENEEIIVTAKIFGEEFERIVEKAAKDLWAYIEALKKPTVDRNYYETGLNQSFSKVLKSALKVEDDLVNKYS